MFTDVDCGYCRKLHREVAQLNELGVEVRYLAYPRQGKGTRTYQKMASAWCAKDGKSAMAKLKAGENIPVASCDSHPLDKHYAMGSRFGVTGTPAILLENGELIGGYMPAAPLATRVLAASAEARNTVASAP